DVFDAQGRVERPEHGRLHREGARTCAKMSPASGEGLAFAVSTARAIRSAARVRAAPSACAETPLERSSASYTTIGSRAFHFSTSSAGRYFAGSPRECPVKRYVFISRSD